MKLSTRIYENHKLWCLVGYYLFALTGFVFILAGSINHHKAFGWSLIWSALAIWYGAVTAFISGVFLISEVESTDVPWIAIWVWLSVTAILMGAASVVVGLMISSFFAMGLSIGLALAAVMNVSILIFWSIVRYLEKKEESGTVQETKSPL